MEIGVAHQTAQNVGQVIFDSKFSSGNLLRVERNSIAQDAVNNKLKQYNLWIGNDHEKSMYRTWFMFAVSGVQPNTMCSFTIKNMSNQSKLLKQGMVPVFRSESSTNWRRIPLPIQGNTIIMTESGLEFTFRYLFESKLKILFAFTYPWTIEDNAKMLLNIEEQCWKSEYFFRKSILGYSGKGLPLEIVTMTTETKDKQELTKEQLSLESGFMPTKFQKKIGIFISARVHPGQVPSSHVLNGILKFLVSGDQKAYRLMDKCVFYIVPMINPDGVDRGLFRSDSQGQNLNRYYANPTNQQPEILAIKQFLTAMIDRKLISFCLDLHAHAAKKGIFIYGNSVSDFSKQLQVCLLPKLLQINNPHFDYDACNFSQKNMYSTDKGDSLSKEGAARVAIFKETGLHTCWTMECNYHSGRLLGPSLEKSQNVEKFNINTINKRTVMEDPLLAMTNNANEIYSVDTFEQMGRSICESLVDYYELDVFESRVYSSPLKSMKMLKMNLAVSLLRMVPFRYDNNIRKLLSKLLMDESIHEALVTLSKLLDSYVEDKGKVVLKIPKPKAEKQIVLPVTSKVMLDDRRSTSKMFQSGRSASVSTKAVSKSKK